ncbi:MAG: DNA primase [Candidatus Diapherotrites archaeon]|nr:DNA primase [Candidatus Diapherotrites archaeon]
MGKTYIDTVKYLIKGTIEIDGIVEKPDVVGAIFGQTEGLLTDELDLRELLKAGKIGRIEVDIKVNKGKCKGTIELPSSLDKSETALIGAVLETVDRVGPCTAKIAIKDIDDTRASKRDFVMNRAKALLKDFGGEHKETKELTGEIKASQKTAKLKLYGPEKLPAGPDVDSSDEIIVVEGRADVLTLLKAGMTNMISLKGAVIPKTVVALSKTKEVTMFVDGDRGGDMVVRNFSDSGRVEYVAKAPDGKEVEELTQKEILKCLKNRLPFKRFALKSSVRTPFRGGGREPRERSGGRSEPRERSGGRSEPRERSGGRSEPRERSGRDSRERGGRERGGRSERGSRDRGGREPRERRERPAPTPVPNELSKIYDTIKGSMKAVLLNKDGKALGEVQVAELVNKMRTKKEIDKVVFDGIITQRLIDLAAEKKVGTIVGLKKAKIEDRKGIAIYTMA